MMSRITRHVPVLTCWCGTPADVLTEGDVAYCLGCYQEGCPEPRATHEEIYCYLEGDSHA